MTRQTLHSVADTGFDAPGDGEARAQPPADPSALAGAILCALRDRIQIWIKRARSRRQLCQHIEDGSILRQDLGVQFGDAQREVSKPFWRS
jgi:uncharacterized protein YjiS (DUF1127 family)